MLEAGVQAQRKQQLGPSAPTSEPTENEVWQACNGFASTCGERTRNGANVCGRFFRRVRRKHMSSTVARFRGRSSLGMM